MGDVTVIDGATNSTTKMNVAGDSIAIAVNPVTNKIYTANAYQNVVAVIDGSTNNVTTVPTDQYPSAVAVNPLTNKIYVANSKGNTVSAIDGASNTVKSINVGAQPAAIAVNVTNNKIYVANFASDDVTVIDGNTNSTTSLSVGTGPEGIGVNPVTNRVYVANWSSNTISVIDGTTGTVIATIPTGENPEGVLVDSVTNHIYISNYFGGTVTIIDGASNTTSLVSTGVDTWQMALNPMTSLAYAVCNYLTSVDIITPSVIQKIPLGIQIQGVPDPQTISGTAIFATSNPSPSFTATVTDNFPGSTSTPSALLYQLDTVQGQFQAFREISQSGGTTTFSLPLSNVQPGVHILYTYSTYGEAPTVESGGYGTGHSPKISNIVPYMFAVVVTPTTTLLSADVNPQAAGQNVTFTAHVQAGTGSGTPSGTVTILDGSAQLGQATLDGTGNAVFATSALTVGAHAITAVYGGNTSFGSSTSAVLTETIQPSIIQIVVTPSTATIKVGAKQQYTATGFYSDGTRQDLTTQVVWYTSYPNVATISAGGLATGVGPGTTTIYSILNGSESSGSVTLIVQGSGQAAIPTFLPKSSTSNSPITVVISDTTLGANIYYTGDGSIPTTASASCASPCSIAVPTTTIIKAIGGGNGYDPSAVSTATYTIQALAPTFSPGSGTYYTGQNVTLSDSTPGVNLYYTTNGSIPTTASTLYTGPIAVTSTTTIKAIAAGNGYGSSSVAVATYTMQALAPTFSPGSGTFYTGQNVTLSDGTPGVNLYYTTNGSIPTTASTLYTRPIAVATTTTIKAIAAGNGYGQSSVAVATYNVQALAPTFSPGSGTYKSGQSFTLLDATPGVTIYYTTNGSIPTTASTPYTGPIAVTTTATIKAIAAGNGFGGSSVSVATYTITQ